ncbi:hypothetical protein [Williamsia sp. D3]|uniref:hypothetical protein n=1 Tax=Williamsia sp. D3 TaxID=1313067 RepID=UPI0003D30172|nr:hypothetical protein [Williamsia sp. D3]ETD31536.1 hypothetical protein W823_19345 [Williamsia sp. D3]
MPVEIPSRPGKGRRPRGDETLLEQLLNYWFGNLFAALRGDGGGILAGAIDGIQDLFEFFNTKWETVEAHTEAITKLEDVAATFAVTPAYIADIQDMASCPRGSLVKYNSDGDVVFPTFLPQTYAFSSTGRVYFTPIIVDRAGTVEKIRWVVGSQSSILSIDDYRLGLMVYNPANGNLEKVWDSGNLKDAQPAATDLKEVWIDMGIDQQCTPGQLLFVAHMQVAPGLAQGPRAFAMMPQAGVGRPPDLLLDASSYRTNNGRSGIASSISLASLERVNDMVPWAAVSVAPLVGP